ncbi:MAG: peptidylprolyl isomerase [Bdellovibrionales bacterium]|nr:peptidylprolyl isomerase [Bdellovibrionales bacterium]
MSIKWIFLSFISLFILPSALAQTIATVGEKKITLQYFQEKYSEVKNQTVNYPSPQVFLEDVIRFEVGVQEAEKKGLRDDKIVKERFRQELYRALIENAIGKKVEAIKVTEKEMKRFYSKNPELRSSHILIEFKKGASTAEKAAAKKRALEIYKEVRGSKRPFNELVKLYSDDTLSKQNGGDIGYQSGVTLVPNYYNALKSMKVNQVRGLIETRYGYHIVKLTGKRSYTQANKRQIRAAVFDEERTKIFNAYFKALKNKYKITVNKDVIKQVK